MELHHDRRQSAKMGLAARKRFLEHPTWLQSTAQVRSFLLSLSRSI